MICYHNKGASEFQLIKNVFLIHAMPKLGKEKCGLKFTTVVEERDREGIPALN